VTKLDYDPCEQQRLPGMVQEQPFIAPQADAVPLDGLVSLGRSLDGWRVAAVTLALVDALALATALGLAGTFSLPALAYAGAALVVGRQPRVRICLRVSDQVGRILIAAVVPLLLALPWLPADQGWRLAACTVVCVVLLRSLAYGTLRTLRRDGLIAEPTVVVGAGEIGVHIAQILNEHRELGLRPIGFFDSLPPPGDLPLPVLGSTAELSGIIDRLRIRRVIVCFPVDRDRDMVPVLRACQTMRVDICLVPRLQELGVAVPAAFLDEVWGIPLMPLRARPRGALVVKRTIDVLLAAVLLCILLPVLVVFGLAMRLQSGRPALFRQSRVTRAGRTASIIKLRTIGDHGDPDRCWKVPNEGCTRLAQWLRAHHVDELPQLVNVLRGEMSLVGPRPERPYFASRFAQEIPRYDDRHRMTAGITGWAQVHGLTGDTSLHDRIRFDNRYIESWSPWLDVVVLARTAAVAIVSSVGGGR